MNNTDRAEAIRARLAAATNPQTWYVKDGGYTVAARNTGDEYDEVYVSIECGDAADGELIANAPGDLAWALGRLVELEVDLDTYKRLAAVLEVAHMKALRSAAIGARFDDLAARFPDTPEHQAINDAFAASLMAGDDAFAASLMAGDDDQPTLRELAGCE